MDEAIYSVTHVAHGGRELVATVRLHWNVYRTERFPGYDLREPAHPEREYEIKTMGFGDPAACERFAIREAQRALGWHADEGRRDE